MLRVETARTSCYDVPRPAPPGPLFEACEGFEACLTIENANLLELYMKKLDRWARQMEMACSETPTELGETE